MHLDFVVPFRSFATEQEPQLPRHRLLPDTAQIPNYCGEGLQQVPSGPVLLGATHLSVSMCWKLECRSVPPGVDSTAVSFARSATIL